METTEFNWSIALILLIISCLVLLWQHYVGLFRPLQWLSPENKVIVITGCDTGIGFQLAQHFHKKGCYVIATVLSIHSEGAIKLKNELSDDHFHILQLNILDKKQIKQVVDDVEHILNQNNLMLHALVNNAGISVFGEFDFCTIKHIEDQININLLGPIMLTKSFLHILIRDKARIINSSSVNAMQPFPGIGVYSATKKGIEAFSESLRMELHKFKVQVINVRLGDYARLTNIMTQHSRIVEQQEEELKTHKQDLYGDYFRLYHESALKNYGMFSPKSFESSSLFDDFDEAIFAVKPRKYILSATLSYRLIIYFLVFLPIDFREYILRRFTNVFVTEK